MSTSPPLEHPSVVLRRLERTARRRFGQNFLADAGALRRIAQLARVGPGDRVIEIGPGLGALSRALLATGASVLAVELDRDLAAFLATELPELSLVQGDALAADWSELSPEPGAVVCGNLPYNVATPLVMRLLEEGDRFSRLVLMFQHEVAGRLAAVPRTRAYGSLSVSVQSMARVSLAFGLPPGAFHPAPKVRSAVVVLEPYAEPLTGGLPPQRFQRAVRAGFSQRRKKLSNALSAIYGKAPARAALEQTVGLERRAEELDLAEWGRLAAALEAAC